MYLFQSLPRKSSDSFQNDCGMYRLDNLLYFENSYFWNYRFAYYTNISAINSEYF